MRPGPCFKRGNDMGYKEVVIYMYNMLIHDTVVVTYYLHY